ncbi:MAG TPA: hypothetical protein VMA97_06835 [Streptosporangiaceae bacterium]|nr:hypothetical protein [Streptosporangiaceae bacterium]
MDCQRAEAHLRLLAEEELRHPAWAWGERRIRVGRVAELLTAIGALDDEVAGRILADFDLALVARQADAPGRRGLAAGSWRRSAAVRFRPATPVTSPSPASSPVPAQLVRLGQVVSFGGGEVYLLSYAQTEPGPQLSLFVRSTRQDGPSGPEAESLEQFTATDDRGTCYQMMVRDLGGGTDGWTLMLRPRPPYDPQWLDLITVPGRPAVRVDLEPSARPPQGAMVTASPVTASPGDHVLHAVAARLLTRADLNGFALRERRESAPGSGPRAPGADGFGDVIAALQAAGALSPFSPVPGQFAALCARLHLTRHGITAPPARDLPEPWLSMLAHYHGGQARTAPAADGGAAAAVALPELDEITLAVLGLHNCLGRTVVHMHASGPMNEVSYGAAGLYYWPVTWIRDDDGRWHATRTLGRSGNTGGTALRVEVVPPLSRATTAIEVITTGRSAEARAELPLRWELEPTWKPASVPPPGHGLPRASFQGRPTDNGLG